MRFLVLMFTLMILYGCTFPVSIRPEVDERGRQIPALVTIEQRQDAAGKPIPVLTALEARTDAKGQPVPILTSVEPRTDAKGLPIPLPVVQTQPPPEAPRPEFAEVSERPVYVAPAPLAKPVPVATAPGFDWQPILAILGVVAGAAGGGWGLIAQRAIGTLRTAVISTAAHADRMEHAETEADVDRVKTQSALEQRLLGVFDVIKELRGKE